MAVIGTGTSNGGCSLLHAAGLGYGASLALDLPVTVRLLDKQSKRVLDDPDDLLGTILQIWRDSNHPLPDGEVFWSVKSEIPPRQGLKSSSAIAVAAIKALCDASDYSLDNADIVDIAAAAQITSGVSITGSYGDSWAALEGGWKLIDANAADARSGVLLESPGPNSEDWNVLLVCRGDRERRPEIEDFSFHQQAFVQALNALQEGNDLVALTWNGRGVVGAVNDPVGRKLTNDAFVNGARAAGISGSGPAIAIFSPAVNDQALSRLKKWYSRNGDFELIETKIINAELAPVEE
jgi:shikimate kinase